MSAKFVLTFIILTSILYMFVIFLNEERHPLTSK